MPRQYTVQREWDTCGCRLPSRSQTKPHYHKKLRLSSVRFFLLCFDITVAKCSLLCCLRRALQLSIKAVDSILKFEYVLRQGSLGFNLNICIMQSHRRRLKKAIFPYNSIFQNPCVVERKWFMIFLSYRRANPAWSQIRPWLSRWCRCTIPISRPIHNVQKSACAGIVQVRGIAITSVGLQRASLF